MAKSFYIFSLVPVFLISACSTSRVSVLNESHWQFVSIDSVLPGSSWGTAGFTLADVDLDGDLDVTVSRREISGGMVYWYENSPGPWKRRELGISDEAQLGAVSVDVNDDRYPDLVVSRYWFENPGTLDQNPDSLWTRHEYPGGLPSENHDILACDLNGDGKKEILCYSQKAGNGTIRAYHIGPGETWKYYDISTGVNNTVSRIQNSNGVHGGFAPSGAGDLDGDRYADIVMPGGWYKNPGKQNDTAWQFIPWPFAIGKSPNLYGVSIRSWVADLDRDRDNDIVFTDCDNQNSRAYWIENIERGRQFVLHSLPFPGDLTGSFHSLAVADFDGDGDQDIFSGEQEDPDRGMKPEGLNERGFFWENTGTRRYPRFEVRIIHTGNPGWHDVQIGDMDQDGDPDIVSKEWNKDGAHYHLDLWKSNYAKKRRR